MVFVLTSVMPVQPPKIHNSKLLETSFNSDKPRGKPTKTIETLTDFYTEIMRTISDTTLPPSLNVLNPEIMGKAFAETHQVILKTFINEPEAWDQRQKKYIEKLEVLYQNTMDRLHGSRTKPIIAPDQNDKRFKASEWEELPIFDYIKQSYLLQSAYIFDLINSLDGLSKHSKQRINFFVKNLLDATSPTNFPFTNPEVCKEIIKTNGQNLIKGYKRFVDAQMRGNFLPQLTDLSKFKVGQNLAITEGKVIFENHLFQLIYYKPKKEKVYQQPLLLIPPWINKFYIFDLQAENSFVSWMLDQGIQVFTISWVNPDASYSDISLDDYVIDGTLQAINCIKEFLDIDHVHALAYCAGGVAAYLLAGYLANDPKNSPLKSLTLLATPIDFDKIGDLKVFICEEQLKHIEQNIQKTGFLSGEVMVNVFSILRANDLIWSNFINTYFLDKDLLPLDFLYWNCDTTHIPAKMHIEYLRHFFLDNCLASKNGYKIKGLPISLDKIDIPLFIFATKNDHIVPWQSSFAILDFCKSNTTFVLGASGHVAGIINPESPKKYCHWINNNDNCAHPDQWLKKATEVSGSWWLTWSKWLTSKLGRLARPKAWKDIPQIEPAPGRYATATAP